MKIRLNGFFSKKNHVFILTSIVSLMLIVAAYFYHRHSTSEIAQIKGNELRAIADSKIYQIVRWNYELNSNAKILSTSPFFVAAVEKWLNNKNNVQLAKDIILRLELLRKKFASISLNTPSGKLLLVVRTDSTKPNCVFPEFIKQAIAQNKITSTDFYFCGLHNTVHYDVVAPIFNASNEAIAVVVLRIDPTSYFYPIIQTWPIPSKSSETFVVKKDGDSILYLNELRHRKGKPFTFRLPLSNVELPAAQVVMGKRGFVVGKDYRGVDVIAYMDTIPGTNWFMVAKVDKDEIFAELKFRNIITTFFVLSLIVMLSIGMVFVYNYRQKNTYKALYEKIQHLYNILDRTGRMAKVGGWEFNAGTFEGTWTAETARIHDLEPDEPTNAEKGLTFYYGESKEKITKAVDDAIHKGIGYNLELEMISAKGVRKWVHTIGVPIVENGKTVRIEGVFQDITERKQLIADLIKAKEKAEESDKLKTAILMNMSHEIRTPLNGILGFAQVLSNPDLPRDKILEYSNLIYQSGSRLLNLLNNVMTLSRIETGSEEIIVSAFNVNTLLEEVCEQYIGDAQSKGIEMSLAVPTDSDSVNIISDRFKVGQILSNLLSNAVKFTEKGSIEVGYSTEPSSIKFFVKDTGIGIPQEYQQAIFERFVQVDMSLSRGYEGAGLGLPISKGLVKLLGGTLWVESEPNEGSTFYFTIPIQPK